MGRPAAHQPRSWAEDLNTYRATRGSQAYSTLQPASHFKRMPRTVLAPLGNPNHPAFSTGDALYTPCKQDGSLEQYARHGWGDVSLLKPTSTRPTQFDKVPKPRPQSPSATKDHRNGLFGTIQGSEAGLPSLDCWMGNMLVDPKKGKQHAEPPPDPRGRKGLFDVLNMRSPGRPSDDSWMGNQLVNPSLGKAHAPGPEERMGRPNLFDIFQQKALKEANKGASGGRAQDGPLSDAWLGHMLINPQKGKLEVQTLNSQDHLVGMRWDPKAFKDIDISYDNVRPRPQGKLIMQEAETQGKRNVVRGLLVNAPVLARDERPEPQHPKRVLPESMDMYAAMAPGAPWQPPAAAPQVTRRALMQPIVTEAHCSADERFAWTVKPRAVRQAADAAVAAASAPRQPSPLAGPTHPVVTAVQPTAASGQPRAASGKPWQ